MDYKYLNDKQKAAENWEFVRKGCAALLASIFANVILLALVALLFWWLIPVATAGVVVLGFWQAYAATVVAYYGARVLGLGFGIKKKAAK